MRAVIPIGIPVKFAEEQVSGTVEPDISIWRCMLPKIHFTDFEMKGKP